MKNLKKGLAVAMSLAMVATVVPAMNTTVVNAACDVDTAQAGVTYIDDIKSSIDVDTVNLFDEADLSAVAELTNLQGIVDCSGIYGEEYVTIAKKLIGVFTASTSSKVYEYENKVMELISYVGELDDALTFTKTAAEQLSGDKADLAALKASAYAVQDGQTESDIKLTFDGTLLDGLASSVEYKTAVDLIEVLEGDYKGNVDSSLQAIVDTYLPVLQDLATEYKEDNIDKTVKDYVDAINAINTLSGNKTVKELLDGTTAIPFGDVTKVKAIITAIKGNKVTSPDTLPSKYADMEDEPEVVEIMDALEEVVDVMTDVQTFSKSFKKTTAFKDYSAAINTSVATVVGYAADDFAKEISKSGAELDTAEITKIKTFVEEIMGDYYEVEKTERTNGTYRVTVKGLENARFLGTIDGDVKPTNLVTLLTKLLDKEEGTTYYDALIDITLEVNDAIKAITTGIKGVTTSNLSASNVNKVIAADKAYGVLTGNTISSYYGGNANGWEDIPEFTAGTETGYKHNLTSAQAKTVKGQIATLKNLVAKMYALGLEDTELKTGWVDLGNGNWDFFNEDGTVATKWVAAGKDWYYVKASHMLRNSWVAQDASGKVWYYVDNAGKMVTNTTVDGYVINANGEWHK